MAIDHEELKRRRQQRQAQRRAQQKRTIVKLVVAGIALALCGVIVAIITTTAGRSKSDPKPSVPETTVARDLTTIRLAAAGDVNITEAILNAGGADQDYNNVFMDVAHLLADADITALNFEGILYGTPSAETRSAPPQLLQSLADAGVDMVQLANSYSIRGGISGLKETINAVKVAGLEPLGVYESNQSFAQEKGYTIMQVQGIRIAFVAFTKGMDGMALPAGSEDCVNLLYTDYSSTYQQVDTEGITAVLEAVAQEKPDLTVAMLHWGSEYNDTVSKSQEEICNLLRENGVDAILGTHSHFLQKMVLDSETGTFVAYSLGDFLGDAPRAGSEYSVILELEITKDNEAGTTAITGFAYTPVFIAAQKDQPVRILRIREAIAAYEAGQIDRVSQQTYEAMKYALTRIEERIAGE